ncbi:hypothetical protein IMZ48_15020 [Candidatus Bathyarchaeota archaeon]|nr:hypothetical protein [Candidatus Bathyarchaeota archaeon]
MEGSAADAARWPPSQQHARNESLAAVLRRTSAGHFLYEKAASSQRPPRPSTVPFGCDPRPTTQ